jgi:hypothetical protein
MGIGIGPSTQVDRHDLSVATYRLGFITGLARRCTERVKQLRGWTCPAIGDLRRCGALVNYRVGLFVRVPEEIGSANRPVNSAPQRRRSSMGGSTHPCKRR